MGPDTIAERVAGGAAATGGVLGWFVSPSIAELNEILQAIVSVVSIVMMIAATMYYVRKSGK